MPVLRIAVTILVGLSGNAAFAAGAKTQGKLKDLCAFMLGAAGGATFGQAPATASQAVRLKTFFAGLSPQQKTDLVALLSKVDFQQLSSRLNSGQGITALDADLQKNPELAAVLNDVVEFGRSFPGIFAVEDPVPMIEQILGVIATDEGKIQGTTSGDLLKSQGMTSRLTMTINTTLVNLIEQMNVEKLGARFGRTFMQNLWYKFSLFVLPAYSRVRNLLGTGQEYQMQLSRLNAVDRLVINVGLADARSLGITNEELAKLTYLVLNSPDEIHEIVKDLKNIFGSTFDIGSPVAIGKFKLYDANGKANDIDFDSLWESFDKSNIDSLNTLNSVVSAARVRKSLNPRTEKEFRVEEIQLRFEAANRRLGHYRGQYKGWTNEDTSEEYSVERRHTRTVEDGKDEKGNTKYRTEVYYTSDNVTPTFENLLSDSFDRGDRSVSGELNRIRERASEMVSAEAGPRNLMGNVGDYAERIADQYRAVMTNGKGKDKLASEGLKLRAQVEAMLKFQREYGNSSDSQIHARYVNDGIKNFHQRNAWMLTRLNNAVAYLDMVNEGFRRGIPDLTMRYDLMDFTDWLRGLRETRNRNYSIKGLMGATIASATAYVASPQVQMTVQQYTGVSYHDVAHMFASVAQIFPQ